MSNHEFKCPRCGTRFVPQGMFMLEKIICPVCGYRFCIIKNAALIRIIYSMLTFIILIIAYWHINPQTSVFITLFWIYAVVLLKIITYILHHILLAVWHITHKRN